MFEVLLVMVSVGLQSASVAMGPSTHSVRVAAAPMPAAMAAPADEPVAEPVLEPTAQAEPEPVAPPVFLSPEEPKLVAEPQVPTGKFTTALEVRPILNATRGSWITIREYDGKDLVYVTHLWSWRCGLLELRVGINGNTPEPWPLPECHMDQPAPSAILDTDGVPYRGYGLGSIAMIEVQITYDDLTTDSVKYNRQGVPIQ